MRNIGFSFAFLQIHFRACFRKTLKGMANFKKASNSLFLSVYIFKIIRKGRYFAEWMHIGKKCFQVQE